MRRRAFTVLAAASAATLLAGCSSSNPLATGSSASGSSASGSSTSITIGSLNFPESQTLASIYSQALQAKGVHVTEKFNIGAREITMPALKDGSIDLIPEYSGSVLTYLDPKSTASSPDDVLAALKTKLPSGLEVLNQASAADSDVLAVTKATATKYGLTTISSLKPVASKLTMGANPEFQTRQAGLVGLKSVYGITFGGYKNLDEAGPLTITALANGQVQVADMFSTDPAMEEKGFVALQDDKFLFAAQNIVPLLRKDVVSPTVVATLNAISAKLTTEQLISMNEKVTAGQSYSTVAAAWLKDNGLA